MDSPYQPPAASDPPSSPPIQSNERATAGVLGGTTICAGLVAAFIGYAMRGIVDSPPAYWVIFDAALGLLPGGLIVVIGAAAIRLSFGERRNWMLGIGFAGVLLAIAVIVTQMWVSGVYFTLRPAF